MRVEDKPIICVSNPFMGPTVDIFFSPLKILLEDKGYTNVELLEDIEWDMDMNNFFEPYYDSLERKIVATGGSANLVSLSAGGEICIEAASRKPEMVDTITLFDSFLHSHRVVPEVKKDYMKLAKIMGIVGIVGKIVSPLEEWFLEVSLDKYSSGMKAAFRPEVASEELQKEYYSPDLPFQWYYQFKDRFIDNGAKYYANSIPAWLNTIEGFDYESKYDVLGDKIFVYGTTLNPGLVNGKLRATSISDCHHIAPLDRPITVRDKVMWRVSSP